MGLERDMNAVRFRAKYVSASENGDYYQVAFENSSQGQACINEWSCKERGGGVIESHGATNAD